MSKEPKSLPNNPHKAFLLGKHVGTRENMNLLAMALTDKAGWHVFSEGPDDRMSIEWLSKQLNAYASEINTGHLKVRDVVKTLKAELNLQIV